jgi:prepilin-type N-terminal cleavage/methylation domain-containing protein
MLARIRKSEESEGGFTLIELLVVMIIIGILAAIAIPVFLSQRAKARDTSTKADVSTIGKEIATYYVDGVASISLAVVPATQTGTLTSADAVPEVTVVHLSKGTDISSNVVYSNAAAKDSTWCVALTNPAGQKQNYQYSAKNGLDVGTCAAGTF